MKAKYIILGLAAVALLMTSCKDSFLEVEPGTKTTLEEYFSDGDHVYEALIAAYAPMRAYDWNGSQYGPLNINAEVMGDNFWPGGQDRTDIQYWHYMNNFEATGKVTISVVWDQSYMGIKRCNDVLTYCDWAIEANSLTDSVADIYREEARILRDWYYCVLWKYYGNLPFYLENIAEEPYLADQISADEVYNQVIADLEGALAIGKLPERWDDANLGRVSAAVGKMLYAEMVLYQNDESRFSRALQYMANIIENPKFDLVDDYASIFTEDGEWTVESIWEINYTDGANGKRAYDAIYNVGGTWLPRLISPSGGVSADGIDNGWGFAPVRQEAYAKFEAGDVRRDATIYTAPEGSYTTRYEDTGMWLNKYIARTANLVDIVGATDANFNNNYRIYRYSEALLNAAELCLRTGTNTEKGYEYLNRVRDRAGLTNVKLTMENILNERDLEFMGEGKRYWDLVRTGYAASVLVPDADGYRTNSWTESKKYLPIPESEINAGQGKLTQNNY